MGTPEPLGSPRCWVPTWSSGARWCCALCSCMYCTTLDAVCLALLHLLPKQSLHITLSALSQFSACAQVRKPRCNPLPHWGFVLAHLPGVHMVIPVLAKHFKWAVATVHDNHCTVKPVCTCVLHHAHNHLTIPQGVLCVDGIADLCCCDLHDVSWLVAALLQYTYNNTTTVSCKHCYNCYVLGASQLNTRHWSTSVRRASVLPLSHATYTLYAFLLAAHWSTLSTVPRVPTGMG